MIGVDGIGEWVDYAISLKVLTSEESALIRNDKDKIILAKIKKMSPDEIRKFQDYRPISLKDYNDSQIEWLNTSRYFLGIKLNRPPTDEEAERDYIENKDRKSV